MNNKLSLKEKLELLEKAIEYEQQLIYKKNEAIREGIEHPSLKSLRGRITVIVGLKNVYVRLVTEASDNW